MKFTCHLCQKTISSLDQAQDYIIQTPIWQRVAICLKCDDEIERRRKEETFSHN